MNPKIIMMIKNDTYIPEHTYLLKNTGIFPLKIVRNKDVFVLQK